MSPSATNGKPPDPSRTRPPTTWVAELFAAVEMPLVTYIQQRLGGDLEAARDVVQEAFVKLCQQSWPEIQPHATAWLYRTCRNRAIDIHRREGRMSLLHTRTDMSSLRDTSQTAPDDRAEQSEQISKLRSEIDELPEQQQELLRLRLHNGLSYKQIAEITGLSATNVGYHLHQAIACLRTRMQFVEGQGG